MLHPLLHAADAAVHCATHVPDSPQLRAQEKLFELQFATHSANVWFCASRSLSIDVPALLAVIPDRNNRSISVFLNISSRGTLVRLVHMPDPGLRKTDTFARSCTISETGSGPDCRKPSCLVTTHETGEVAARSKSNRSFG
jgi:hypothetical protein